MTGCTESSLGLVYRELEETIESLVPGVEAMLRPIPADGAAIRESEGLGYRFAVPISFPDGIGRGHVVARLFRYRDTVRLDVEIVHNRMLARPGGAPSDRRCYLNDFVASVSIPAGTEEVPPDFVRSVLRGVRAARDAVQRHNRDQSAPWNQVRVVAR
ncbi:MAG: hypothetical protein JSW43_06600 [Gemmatimonadota bacterium]|nr:MAG: hypothetical protein JSW43_06600 [Gemmatimonadota bacterium]